mgnify:CR=1 FL=1
MEKIKKAKTDLVPQIPSDAMCFRPMKMRASSGAGHGGGDIKQAPVCAHLCLGLWPQSESKVILISKTHWV